MIPLVLAAAAFCAIYFTITWVLSRHTENATLVDIAWSYSIAFLVPLVAILADSGWEPRRIAGTIIALAWSLRLGTHLAKRTLKKHPEEDKRYTSLREGKDSPWFPYFFLIFHFQGALSTALTLPFCLAFLREETAFSLMEIIGLSLAAISIAGESLADHQLKTFLKKRTDHSEVCKRGLWRVSRHPNYFFEWLFWVGIGAFGFSATSIGWLALLAPILMLWFLLKVTGIAMSEIQSLKSKGDHYRQYQKETSPFIPWFPKSPQS